MARISIFFAICLCACGAPPPPTTTSSPPPTTTTTTPPTTLTTPTTPTTTNGTRTTTPDDAEPAAKSASLCKDLGAFDLDAYAEDEDARLKEPGAEAATLRGKLDNDFDDLIHQTYAANIDLARGLLQYVAAIASTCDEDGDQCQFYLVTATNNHFGDSDTAGTKEQFEIHTSIRLVGDDEHWPENLDVDLRFLTDMQAPAVMLNVSNNEGSDTLTLYSFSDLAPRWTKKFQAHVENEPCDVYLEAWTDLTCDETKDALVSHYCGDREAEWPTARREAWAVDPGTGTYIKIGEAEWTATP